MQKFRNLYDVECGLQVRIVNDGNFLTRTFSYEKIKDALQWRNAMYESPDVNLIGITVPERKFAVVPGCRISQSGSPYEFFRVHSRQLVNHKYLPKEFKRKVDAKSFAKRHETAYNSVCPRYNENSMARFLAAAANELETENPNPECSGVGTGIDLELWNLCVSEVLPELNDRYF